MICQYCGSEIEDGSLFCTSCGMQQDPSVESAPVSGSTRRRRPWVVPVVLVVVLLLAGSAGFAVWKLGLLDSVDLSGVPFISSFFSDGGEAKPISSVTDSDDPTPDPVNPPVEEISYYLSVYDGKVAIFSEGSDDPYRVTDVEVADLYHQSFLDLEAHQSVSSLDEAEMIVERYGEEAAERLASAVELTVMGTDGTTRTATIHREGTSERVIVDSNTRALTVEEVEALSDAERLIAANEIAASTNGYIFKNSGLMAYFDSCSWYTRTADPGHDWLSGLSPIAKANVYMLQSRTDGWWLNLALY